MSPTPVETAGATAPKPFRHSPSTNKRVLHVQVPDPVFRRAKAAALVQGTDWPEFVVDLLTEAGANLRPASPCGDG